MAKVAFTFIRPAGLTSAEWGEVTGKAHDIFMRNTPVRTGRLRESINMTPTSRSIKGNYGSHAPYAEFLEFGTPNIAPRRMTERTMKDLDMFCRDLKKERK